MNFEELQENEKKLAEEKSKRGFMGQVVAEALLEIEKYFKQAVSELTKAIKGLMSHNYSVKILNPVTEVSVKNFPKIEIPKQLETISFKEAKELLQAINKVQEAIKENKITIPEVNFPKSFAISNLKEPKDQIRVTNLDELAKYLDTKQIVKAIKDSNKKTEIRMPSIAPRFEMKNEELLAELKLLRESIVIPETDLSGVVSASEETTKAIKGLRFPVPNMASSWQHSLQMQSQDLALTGTYRTVNSKKVQDYIQFTANDGFTYRNTFTYDTDGDWTGHTGWVKQ